MIGNPIVVKKNGGETSDFLQAAKDYIMKNGYKVEISQLNVTTVLADTPDGSIAGIYIIPDERYSDAGIKEGLVMWDPSGEDVKGAFDSNIYIPFEPDHITWSVDNPLIKTAYICGFSNVTIL